MARFRAVLIAHRGGGHYVVVPPTAAERAAVARRIGKVVADAEAKARKRVR